jgi:mono/diheme cytochrome c family protein
MAPRTIPLSLSITGFVGVLMLISALRPPEPIEEKVQPAPKDPIAVEHGARVFEQAGCVSCHAEPLHGIGSRAHSDRGLAELAHVVEHYDRRFELHLSSVDKADLVQYLSSL